MNEGEVESPSWGWRMPLGLPLPSPIYRGGGDPSLTHSHTCSHMPFGWHLPPLASWSSFTSTVLRRSPTQDLLHHHHHHVVVLLEFPRIRCFRCPTGARDGGRRRTGRVTDYGCAARLWRWSSRPWGRACTLYTNHVCTGTLSRFRSSRVSPSETVTSNLLDMILGMLQTIGNFLFSMQWTHQWYQSRIYA